MSTETACHLEAALLDGIRRALSTDHPNGRRAGPSPTVLLGPAGRPWVDANDWLHRGLVHVTASTREAYTRDIVTFGTWCASRQLVPAAIDRGDLEDYQDERLTDQEVSGATWNRSVAAIASFLTWLHDAGRIDRLPWDAVGDLRVAPDQRPIIAIDDQTYDEFRTVGLLGRGDEVPADGPTSISTARRDALFADLILCSGLRRAEAASMLILELPDDTERPALRIAAAVRPATGGGSTVVTGAFLAAYDRFLHDDWPALTAAAQHHLRADPALPVVGAVDGGRVHVDGVWHELDHLPVDLRGRLVTTDRVARDLGLPVEPGWLVPLGLFPSCRSPSPDPGSWTAIFHEARARVSRHRQARGLSPAATVSPRTLRQTHGVRFLQEALRSLTDAEVEDMLDGDPAVGRARIQPALAELGCRLGHRNAEATLRYLDAACSARSDTRREGHADGT